MGQHGKYRALVIGAALALALPAEAACRLALAIGLDVSGSVVGREYGLQTQGMAAALEDRDVVEAILAIPGEVVAITVFEWSSSAYQRPILGWSLLVDETAIARAADRIRSTTRGPAPEATGIGQAMRHAGALFASGPDCDARTLDLSGDGANNDWPAPERVRAAGSLGDATVNALVIAPAEGLDALERYFRAQVISGPGAFVERAEGYADYARAMRLKLLKELTALAIGDLPDIGHPGATDARFASRALP